MISSDNDSKPSETSTTVTNPFSIVARSVASSKLAQHTGMFSGAKHTVSGQRASLKGTIIELLECLKLWFRLGIFTEQDLLAIIDTIEAGATEALKELDENLDC